MSEEDIVISLRKEAENCKQFESNPESGLSSKFDAAAVEIEKLRKERDEAVSALKTAVQLAAEISRLDLIRQNEETNVENRWDIVDRKAVGVTPKEVYDGN